MNEALKLLLSLSLSGSIMAVLIFALKPLAKQKLSKSVQYYTWIVVLLRLVLPFSFESSIMNKLFYGSGMPVAISGGTAAQSGDKTISGANESVSNPYSLPNVKENVARGVYSSDTDHSRYFRDLFNQYALYLWLFGTIIALTINIIGYIRFSKHVKQANKSATEEERKILVALQNRRNDVGLVRNPLIGTPMLIGLLNPYIIIPDIEFNEKQLKYILLHEISHLKHFDIAVKWLTMIITSIHWFNPLMYFIKKEINHTCELACDERVIKNLSSAEKQAYGETLISVVAEHKYPTGVLQATMCEEKKSLRERLIAIMNHNKKTKFIMVFSAVLLGLAIVGALYLGAGVETGKDTPSNLLTYNLAEVSKYKTPYIGDHIKVGNVASHLPVPDKYFRQQYISMVTDNKPYKLTIYYEAATDARYEGEWPDTTPHSNIETNSRKNALVVFCMIDNLDEFTFAYRTSKSEGRLDTSKYDASFVFSRASFEEKYGNLSTLGKDIDLLQDILTGGELEPSNGGTHKETEIKLLNAPVSGQVNILISPTIMGTNPYYYCPNNQQKLSEMINEVEWTEVRNYPHGLHRLGVSILQDDIEWDLLDDGSLYYFEDHGLSAKCFHGKSISLHKEIIKILHEDLNFTLFDTSQIADIIAAKIIYTQNGTKKTITQRITDSKALTVIEERFGHAKPVEGGTACPFNEALLILETRNDIEIPIRLASDSCPIYFANGRYFDYGGNNRDILYLFDNIPWRGNRLQ